MKKILYSSGNHRIAHVMKKTIFSSVIFPLDPSTSYSSLKSTCLYVGGFWLMNFQMYCYTYVPMLLIHFLPFLGASKMKKW